MTMNTIHATYTETYDLNTINGDLSLLAIHTPQAPSLKQMFHGFFEQYKKFKVLGCNFRMSCASQQALTPNLIGIGGDFVSARDVMNPILFKACTGEGMNVLLDQIYNKSEEVNTGGSISEHRDTGARAVDAYYALLADDSFRKEHPQKGITVMGLKPYVHRVVTTQPFKWSSALSTGTVSNDVPRIASNGALPSSSGTPYGFAGVSGSSNYETDPVNPSVFVSNGLIDMPWLDTAFSTTITAEDKTRKVYALATNIPRVYMGVLVLPPSESKYNLFYRLQIVWHIAFRDFRPAQDLAPTDLEYAINTPLELNSTNTYWNLYHTSSKLKEDYGSFDTSGIESVEKITEKVN